MSREVHRGATLEYRILYPDGYREGAAYPLLIWLHGFGADMDDLVSLANAIHPAQYLHVLPNAPLGGFGGPEGTVRAWFERGGKERPGSVRLAQAGLDVLVHEVLARFLVPPGRTVLVGFSQGGNLALRHGLSRPETFAGVAALSCSLRQADDLRANLPGKRSQALFLAHGLEDQVVPIEWSRQTVAFLKEQGYQPVYDEYPIGHEIDETLLADLQGWVRRVLGWSPDPGEE